MLNRMQQKDLQIRKAIGREHLNNNRLNKALEVYAALIQDYPQDVETYLVMGDIYLSGEDCQTAAQLYELARQIDPENPDIEYRLYLARSEAAEQGIEPVPTHPQAVAHLLQRLTNSRSKISQEEVEKAAALLSEIVHSANPAQKVAQNLDQIDALLPALLELNIRQARADGRPDLAEVLSNLQMNIELQLQSRDLSATQPVALYPQAARAETRRLAFNGRVLLLAADPGRLNSRMAFLAEVLSQAGAEVMIQDAFSAEQEPRPAAVVASNPHGSPGLLESLAACTAARIPIILDLDCDFEHMPVTHPDYGRSGLGSPANARSYTAALLLADKITVPSAALAEALQRAGYPAQALPDGWSERNPLWSKPAPPRDTLNIGWVGLPGQVEDVAQIRRVILRVVREFPHTQLVIAGDSQTYQLFESLPENRRLFLPTVEYEDYPYLLGQIDILLAPFRNNPFNYTGSDRLLMEAGVKKIPWIASPLPAAANWHAGGLIAGGPEEWHTYLRQLVLDAELRARLAEEGHRRALERRVECLGHDWLAAIEQVRRPAAIPLMMEQPESEPIHETIYDENNLCVCR